MNRTIQGCAIVCFLTMWILIPLLAPWVLSSKNAFLEKFINEQLLGFLSVVVTITLASCANLYLTLNNLEEAINKPVFNKTRATIRKSAYYLITMLFFAVLLLISKSLIGDSERTVSFVNGAGILIVFLNILVLIDLTQMAFKITPHFN